MKIYTFLLAAILLSGCSAKQNKQQEERKAAEAEARSNEVLVEVNGHKLLMGEAITRMNKELGQPPQNIPSDRVRVIKHRKLKTIINGFVIESLLASEAERLEIEVTEAEKQEALDRIRAKLPEGMTWDEYVKKNETKLDTALVSGLRVQKLLNRIRSERDSPPVTDEEVKAYATAINAQDVPHDVLKKRVIAERERAALDTYLNQLRGRATINHSHIITISKDDEPVEEAGAVNQ